MVLGSTEILINGDSITVGGDEIKDHLKDGKSWSADRMCHCFRFNHYKKVPYESEKSRIYRAIILHLQYRRMTLKKFHLFFYSFLLLDEDQYI